MAQSWGFPEQVADRDYALVCRADSLATALSSMYRTRDENAEYRTRRWSRPWHFPFCHCGSHRESAASVSDATFAPMKPNTSPWEIKQPCTADWEKMRGDDKRRFCEHCQKFVHNVSAMSRTERAAFASPANRGECVLYCQRTDGKVANLSLLVRLRRWFPFLRLACWSALVALLPVTLTGCMGVRCRPGDIRPIQPNATPTSSQTTGQSSSVEPPR